MKSAEVDASPAKALMEAAGVRAGLCVHLGVTDGRMTADLGRQGHFVVHGLAETPARLEAARRHVHAQGLYGRVSIEGESPAGLPYADASVNLLVVSDAGRLLGEKLPLSEVLRVLAPGGGACLEGAAPSDLGVATVRATIPNWTVLTKPFPKGGDEWTHFNYDATSNRVSKDELVEPFQRLRWVAGVEWPMPDYYSKSMVVGGGRVYYVINESPTGRESPWLWLSVRDAFSGALLWKVSPAPKALTMIADGPHFYMESNGKMAVVDGATGAFIRAYDEAAEPNWAYLHEDRLLVSCGPSGVLKCLDPETGALRWSFDKQPILPFLLAGVPELNNAGISGEDIVYVDAEKQTIGCIDLATGAGTWHREVGKDLDAPGKVALNACHNGVMVVGSPKGIAAFSSKDGRHLWSHTYERLGVPTRRKAKSYRDGFFIDGLYWTHVGDLDPAQPEKYRYTRGRRFSWQGIDPATGKVMRVLKYPEGQYVGASCFPDQATTRYFMGGYSDFLEIQTGEYRPRATALKTSCRIGPRVAYGLLYNTTLYQPGRFLQGDMALEGAGQEQPRPGTDPSRLEKGPAFGAATGAPAGPGDWPCYRHDSARTSRSSTQVPATLVELWSAGVGAQPSAPVVANGMVLVASADTNHVMAFDAAGGTPRWTFTAGSRVRVPPAYSDGRCLFGAADGWVYCLDAANGQLAWRFEAARTSRRILARERIESPWPVDDGVLVHDGLAYFVAGRHGGMDGGVDFYALECASGKVVWHKNDSASSSARLLSSDGKTVWMGDRDVRFGLKSIEQKVQAPAIPAMVNNRDALFPSWIMGKTATVTMKLSALLHAGGVAFAAGKPDPAKDPSLLWQEPHKAERFANFPAVHPLAPAQPKDEGWMLWAFSADDGRKLAETKIAAQPVWDGMAAAGGRLYLTTQDGKLRCFGAK